MFYLAVADGCQIEQRLYERRRGLLAGITNFIGDNNNIFCLGLDNFGNFMKRRKYRFWSSLYILIPAILVIGFIGYKMKSAEIAQAKMQVYEKELARIEQENQELVRRLAVSESQNLDVKDPATIKKVICSLWGDKCQEALKVQSCENGTLDPERVNTSNKDKSVDKGIFQINSIHQVRIEKIFNQSYKEAMGSPWKNIIFAYIKYQEEGFRPWYSSNACHKSAKK